MCLLCFILGSTPGLAQNAPEGEYQNPFSDYVPFEDEYEVDEDERFMYFGRFFGVSVGTGSQFFGGNIGRLYNLALPTFEVRLLYFFDFRMVGQASVSSANHAFHAVPNNFVEVNLLRVNVDFKYYLETSNLSADLTSTNPYLIAGVGQITRTQVFHDLDFVGKDRALAISVGGGLEIALQSRKTSIGIEARVHQVFFKDRFEEEYLASGIPDTTGPLFSSYVGILFFF